MKRDTKVFGRDLVTAIPLTLQSLTLLSEGVCKLLHQLGYERVSLLHRTSWLIDEATLDLLPAVSDVASRVFG